MDKEIWMPIRDIEDYAVVSNFGNIKVFSRSVPSKGGVRIIPERILVPKKTGKKYKYCFVGFGVDGKKFNLSVPRIVYETFNNIILDKKKVAIHKDGNIFNNRLDNIKIITRRSLKPKNGSETGYTGVRKSKTEYQAVIYFSGAHIIIHSSKDVSECHKIYQLAKSMIDEYDKIKAGILSNSRLNNKLVVKSVLLP